MPERGQQVGQARAIEEAEEGEGWEGGARLQPFSHGACQSPPAGSGRALDGGGLVLPLAAEAEVDGHGAGRGQRGLQGDIQQTIDPRWRGEVIEGGCLGRWQGAEGSCFAHEAAPPLKPRRPSHACRDAAMAMALTRGANNRDFYAQYTRSPYRPPAWPWSPVVQALFRRRTGVCEAVAAIIKSIEPRQQESVVACAPEGWVATPPTSDERHER
jgi:hypothetical protein